MCQELRIIYRDAMLIDFMCAAARAINFVPKDCLQCCNIVINNKRSRRNSVKAEEIIDVLNCCPTEMEDDYLNKVINTKNRLSDENMIYGHFSTEGGCLLLIAWLKFLYLKILNGKYVFMVKKYGSENSKSETFTYTDYENEILYSISYEVTSNCEGCKNVKVKVTAFDAYDSKQSGEKKRTDMQYLRKSNLFCINNCKFKGLPL